MKKDILNKMSHDKASGTDIFIDSWESAGGVIPLTTEKRIWNHIRQSTRPRVLIFRSHIWKIAAVVLILLLSGITIYQKYELKTATQYAELVITVPKAQKNQLLLPDGTRIWLNSDSELKYGKRFNGHERCVELTGEAYFEVAKNPDAPFTVLAGGISVRALGTSFNIKAYPSDDVVTAYLKEGKVNIQSAAESILLMPGECVNYHYASQRMEKTVAENNHTFLAWHNNQLIFEDEPLVNIARVLEQQYNIKVDIRDERIKNYMYNGTLENTSLVNILDLLTLTSPLVYEYKDSTVIFSLKK